MHYAYLHGKKYIESCCKIFCPNCLTTWRVLASFKFFDGIFQKIYHILQLNLFHISLLPQNIGVIIKKIVNFALFQLELKQGRLLRGNDKKSSRREGIEHIERICSYVFFSVTPFLQHNKMVQNYRFLDMKKIPKKLF